jgi:hypothetical protein
VLAEFGHELAKLRQFAFLLQAVNRAHAEDRGLACGLLVTELARQGVAFGNGNLAESDPEEFRLVD